MSKSLFWFIFSCKKNKNKKIKSTFVDSEMRNATHTLIFFFFSFLKCGYGERVKVTSVATIFT